MARYDTPAKELIQNHFGAAEVSESVAKALERGRSCRFDEQRHLYFDADDRPLESVTQVLDRNGMYSHLGYLDGARAAWLADRGTALHHAVFLWESGLLDPSSVVPEISRQLEAWIDFRTRSRYTPVALECQVYSRALRVAGRVDMIASDETSLPVLIDIKTGAAGGCAAELQLAGYVECLDAGPMQRKVVYLYPSGRWSLLWPTVSSLDDDRRAFRLMAEGGWNVR